MACGMKMATEGRDLITRSDDDYNPNASREVARGRSEQVSK